MRGLANLYSLTTRPKELVTGRKQLVGEDTINQILHALLSSTHLEIDQLVPPARAWMGRKLYRDDDLTHEIVSQSDDLFGLCRTSSLHPWTMDIINTFRYFYPDNNAEMSWNITTKHQYAYVHHFAIIEITSFPGPYKSRRRTWEGIRRLKVWHSDGPVDAMSGQDMMTGQMTRVRADTDGAVTGQDLMTAPLTR